MATMTKEQAQKLTAKMSNNWIFDAYYFLTHSGEKTAAKDIQIDDSRKIKAQIYFTDRYDWKTNETNIMMKINISLFTDGVSYGLGVTHTIAENLPKKLFSAIQKETANWTDEKILEIAQSHYKQLSDGIILDENGARVHEF